MPTIVPRIQNFTSYFIGGDPYIYASVGGPDSIALQLKTSFFVISNEKITVGAGQPDVNGHLKVAIPDANRLGMEIILYLEGADANNHILLSFTGLNANSDEISLINDSNRDFPVVLNLVWIGSAWVLKNGGSLFTVAVS